jgi:hypothetical protein
MAFRRKSIWTSVAIGVALTISALSAGGAQAPGANGEPLPPYRPAAGARDLRAVLFNWTWYMGAEGHHLPDSTLAPTLFT